MPFVLPNVQSFRILTNTVGVDYYSISYEQYCSRDGALQKTARLIDSLGFNATSSSALLPNAAVLRTAETVDAVHNAVESGKQTSTTASAGYLLCSIVTEATRTTTTHTHALSTCHKPRAGAAGRAQPAWPRPLVWPRQEQQHAAKDAVQAALSGVRLAPRHPAVGPGSAPFSPGRGACRDRTALR